LWSVEAAVLSILIVLSTFLFIAWQYKFDQKKEILPLQQSGNNILMAEAQKVSRLKPSRTLKTQTRLKNKAKQKLQKENDLNVTSVDLKSKSCSFKNQNTFHIENRKFVDECKTRDDTLVDDIVTRLLSEQEKRDADNVTAVDQCPFGYGKAVSESEVGEEPVRDKEYVAPVDAKDANDVAMYLLKKSKSLTDEDQLLSESDKEKEAELKQEQLKNIFRLLEENDESFVKSQSGPMAPIYEDEEQYRFRVLEEDGSYSQMSLDNVFKNQIRLYGL